MAANTSISANKTKMKNQYLFCHVSVLHSAPSRETGGRCSTVCATACLSLKKVAGALKQSTDRGQGKPRATLKTNT
jgi:hypothetical protein